jgi:sporulation protein YlmC with PRC-barrel domain
MRSLLLGTVLTAILITPVVAQSNPPAPANRPAATAPAPAAQSGTWRASKLKGLNVYNQQNEKLGEINELLVDKSGKVQGVVIGVGGFLGMGEHDIKVEMSKLRFVNDPPRSASNTTNTTGTATTRPSDRAANTDRRWYPDHAVLNANKDQLKAMPQFKY